MFPYVPTFVKVRPVSVRERQAVMGRLVAIATAAESMSDADLTALQEWERRSLDGGSVRTSDWPGWVRVIGASPLLYVEPSTARPPRKKAAISHRLRWEVFLRDDFRCRVCGVRRDLSADHVIPESIGGPTTLDNLQTLCRRCNSRKGVS